MKQLISCNIYLFAVEYVLLCLPQVHSLQMHHCNNPWHTAIVDNCVSSQQHSVLCVIFVYSSVFKRTLNISSSWLCFTDLNSGMNLLTSQDMHENCQFFVATRKPQIQNALLFYHIIYTIIKQYFYICLSNEGMLITPKQNDMLSQHSDMD